MFRVNVVEERAWDGKGLFSPSVETISLPASLPRPLVQYREGKEWDLFFWKKTNLFFISKKMKVFAGNVTASL